MYFAIRDDDVNYFYSSCFLRNAYVGISEICPVSTSIVPFVKGLWPNNTIDLENAGPGTKHKEVLQRIVSDSKVYPIGDNCALVEYLKGEMACKKIYVTIHGIHHRNEDVVVPLIKNNYGIGAEFYTDRMLDTELGIAIEYTNRVFNQKIEIFTPPQNLISTIGYKAIMKNKLNVCGNIPSIKSLGTVNILGMRNYLKYLTYKIGTRKTKYPYPLCSTRFSIVEHYPLQPATKLDKLYEELKRVHSLDGCFVLSTHSYAFNYKMDNYSMTMKEALADLLRYALSLPDIQFVALNELFAIKTGEM